MSSKSTKSKRKSHPGAESGGGKKEELRQTALSRYNKPRKSSPDSSLAESRPFVKASTSQTPPNPSEQSTITSYFGSSSAQEYLGHLSKGKENRKPSRVFSTSRHHEATSNDLSSPSASANRDVFGSRKNTQADKDEVLVIEDEEELPVLTRQSKKRKSRDWDQSPLPMSTPTLLVPVYSESAPSSKGHSHSAMTKRKRTNMTNDLKRRSPRLTSISSPESPSHVQVSPGSLRTPFKLLFQDVEQSSEDFVGSSQTQYLSPIRYHPTISPQTTLNEGVGRRLEEAGNSIAASGVPPLSSVKPAPFNHESRRKSTRNKSGKLLKSHETIMLSSSEESLEIFEHEKKAMERPSDIPAPNAVKKRRIRKVADNNSEQIDKSIDNIRSSPKKVVKKIRRSGASITQPLESGKKGPARPFLATEALPHARSTSTFATTRPLENPETTKDDEDDAQELEGIVPSQDDGRNLEQILGDRGGSEDDEANPFWETQPLLDMEEEIPSSQSPVVLRLSQSTDFSPRISISQFPTVSQTLSDFLNKPSLSSPLKRTPVQSPCNAMLRGQSLTPKASMPCQTRLSQQDATSTGISLGRSQSTVVGDVLVQDSDSSPNSDPGENDENNDADVTMAEHPRESGRRGSRGKLNNLAELTKEMKQLSPFKKHGQPRVESQGNLANRGIHEEEEVESEKEPDSPIQLKLGFVGWDTNTMGNPYSPSKFESQLPEEQSFEPMSLPSNWQEFYTPTKPSLSRPPYKVKGRNSASTTPKSRPADSRTQESPLFGPGAGDTPCGSTKEDYGEDDAFGPEVTPGPLARSTLKDWPDIVRKFEDQPSPFPGMFSGSPGVGDEDD
ncbi:hypothetical protein CPB86DRAFT_563088 [Serendipita vermifera]|nr:hypothetical protein CPB86DRAFT_563088 [Serendipita vermifera]